MDDFGPPSGLKAFDAFPKVDRHFRAARTARGAALSIVAAICLATFIIAEFTSYLRGEDVHSFAVGLEVQDHVPINVDLTVAMPCEEVHINVQDSTMDLIQAGSTLTKEDVKWDEESTDHLDQHIVEDHHEVGDVLRNSRRVHRGKRLFANFLRNADDGFSHETRPERNGGACRIYGTIDVHHIEGDFHITAVGIGYPADRQTMLSNLNFTHRIDRMSFGDHYPLLTNALDHTHADALAHFHRFQYFLNVVPTTYRRAGSSRSSAVDTFEYAVTESSRHTDGDRAPFFPGIFIKYDFEPVRLYHTQGRRKTLLQFISRLLGCVGGIVAALSWIDRAAGRVRSLKKGAHADADEGYARLDRAVEGGSGGGYGARYDQRKEKDANTGMAMYDGNGGFNQLLDRRRQGEFYT